jgi:trans-2,3-dihydro-3-hydroxyanthranilate isomerase
LRQTDRSRSLPSTIAKFAGRFANARIMLPVSIAQREAMKIQFQTVDVFTDRRFGGNPLAVLPDARGLTSEQMQAIAAEFNLAETTFVLPPKDPAHAAQVRIFTPKAEMPFAGHPNVGTAYVLAHAGSIFGKPIVENRLAFEEIAGLVAMDLLKRGNEIYGARLKAPQPLNLGDFVAVEQVAEACGLSLADIETRNHAPRLAGCGNWFVFAELKSREALKRAMYVTDAFARNFPMAKTVGIHLYVRTVGDGVDVQTRMFAPLYGVPEDPATGSANVALVGVIAAADRKDRLAMRIAQGVDMGRPSLLEAEAINVGGAYDCYIGGACVPVIRGEIEID